MKDVFGRDEHKNKSIMTLMIELLDRSIGKILSGEKFIINAETCECIQAICLVVISLMHGPH